ncbi:MAG: hypothetical protein DRQ48_10570 [Gammaproteobacteria bacterium]|nr:MAG: hypothetical protein DRQ48_10570 [Gammaproteobacteria bacterium]
MNQEQFPSISSVVVAEKYDVSISELRSGGRKSAVVQARCAMSWLCVGALGSLSYFHKPDVDENMGLFKLLFRAAKTKSRPKSPRTSVIIKLIGGKTVQLEAHGTDVHGRTLGTLFVHLREKGEWQNVNERMVTLGHAWVMRLFYDHLPKSRQQKLNQLERWAKSKRVGLWKTTNPVPPWKWRKS